MILFLDFDDTLFNTEAFKKHLEEKGILGNKEAILSFVENNNISHFLFDDTVDFLKNFREHQLVLITFGDQAYQRAKVISSGISHYFYEMIFTGDVSKSVILDEWLKRNKSKDRAIFLDDRVDWLYESQKVNANFIPVRMRREGALHAIEENPHSYGEVRDLKEFARLLSSF